MSMLPLLLNVYERVINEQALNYFQTFFNEILRGFRKAHNNTQHSLFELLLNRGSFFGSILMDFSKVYDCLKGDLLLVKFQ